MPLLVERVFDRTSVAATSWAREHAAEFVTSVNESMRQTVREIIASAYRDGIPTRSVVQILRNVIPLATQQAKDLYDFRQVLATAKPGTIIRRGGYRFRVPRKGFSIETIDRRTERYANKLIRQRAARIARTEINTAAVQGQMQAWRQAVGAGILTGHEQREWITTETPCPICDPLNGQRRGLSELFDGGFDGPPAHVGCLCTLALVPINVT